MSDPAAEESALVAEILHPWIKACHARARKRDGQAFREADDIRDLWKWLLQNRWGEKG